QAPMSLAPIPPISFSGMLLPENTCEPVIEPLQSFSTEQPNISVPQTFVPFTFEQPLWPEVLQQGNAAGNDLLLPWLAGQENNHGLNMDKWAIPAAMNLSGLAEWNILTLPPELFVSP